jgi:hypothetical protein
MAVVDCVWYEATLANGKGERVVRCRRAGCGNAVKTAIRLDKLHANCFAANPFARPHCGTGCQLSLIFSWFGITDTDECGCKAKSAKMDRHGPDWCERKSGRIIGWLRESAAKRGFPFVELAARAALVTAIKRARQSIESQQQQEATVMPGLGESLVKVLPWFDDRGLVSRLDSRGVSWAERRRNRVLQWILSVAKQKQLAITEQYAAAALDAAIDASTPDEVKTQEQVQLSGTMLDAMPPGPVDDPLVLYDANGEKTAGLKNIWRGCAGFLVCGGPSVRDLPYHKLAERGIVSLGVNNVCGMVPVKAMTFNDPAEKFHEGILADGGIMKLIPKPRLARKSHTRRRKPDGGFELTGRNMPDYPNVWAFERRGWHTPETFLTDPAATYGNDAKGHGQTKRPRIIFTMFMALRLMHYLGCRRVYLLGADFHMDPAKGLVGNYAFDDDRYADTKDPVQHRNEVLGVINGNNDHYRVANEMLVELRPFLERAGFYVFNCNPWSRLAAFDHVPFEEALQDCRNGVPEGELQLNGHYRKGV